MWIGQFVPALCGKDCFSLSVHHFLCDLQALVCKKTKSGVRGELKAQQQKQHGTVSLSGPWSILPVHFTASTNCSCTIYIGIGTKNKNQVSHLPPGKKCSHWSQWHRFESQTFYYGVCASTEVGTPATLVTKWRHALVRWKWVFQQETWILDSRTTPHPPPTACGLLEAAGKSAPCVCLMTDCAATSLG